MKRRPRVKVRLTVRRRPRVMVHVDTLRHRVRLWHRLWLWSMVDAKRRHQGDSCADQKPEIVARLRRLSRSLQPEFRLRLGLELRIRKSS